MRIGGWTVIEIVQGKPWAHPTHPMFVHFPTALYPTAFAFDVLAHVLPKAAFGQAATIMLGIGMAAGLGAATTGIIDWLQMIPGSTKRRTATRHFVIQAASQVAAALALAVHVTAWDRRPPVAGMGLLALAVVLLTAGNWFGGVLVYRMAMRVGGSREPASKR